jgi:anti-sigma factor RsiW
MTRATAPTPEEVHAYVDDALDSARRLEIEAFLREDEQLASRIAAYQADRDALRQALAGVMTKTVPASWQNRIEAATRDRTMTPRRWAMAAGIAVFLAAGGGATLLWHRDDSILTDAMTARAAGLDGGTPLNATDETQLASALGLKVHTPDLQHFGFRLVRLEVSETRSAQMEYHDGAGRRLTIYVRPSNGKVRFDLLREGAARVCVWQDDVVGAVIIAPMSAGEMMRVASSAYAALNL